MRLTDITVVNKHARQWRKAVTLKETVTRRLAWHEKNSAKTIGAGHRNRAREIIDACEREEHAEWPGREINSYLSSRPILNIGVKEILRWVFRELPEPGPAQHDDLTHSMVELMNNKGRETRAQQHRWNLEAEIAYRTTHGWYVLFNTLTVGDSSYHTVFAKDSKEFKNYVRHIEREITSAETGTRNTKRGTERPDNHRYFAVVEEGGKTGRLHIHVVHLIRRVPNHWHDPNRGRPRPIYREISHLKRLWKHGHSSPIAARFSPRDAWGLLGWRWPIDTRTNDALKIKHPLALANYMSKYINKGYTSCKRAKLLWRVRKSQSLGRPILEALTSTLTQESLTLITTDDSIKPRLNNSPIPSTLLRQQAMRRLDHLYTTSTRGSRGLMEVAKVTTPRPSLLHSLRGSTPSITANNQQNTIVTLTNNISNTADYNEARAAVYAAARHIDGRYYRRSLMAYGKTSTEDWIYPKNEPNAQAQRTRLTNTSRNQNIKQGECGDK